MTVWLTIGFLARRTNLHMFHLDRSLGKAGVIQDNPQPELVSINQGHRVKIISSASQIFSHVTSSQQATFSARLNQNQLLPAPPPPRAALSTRVPARGTRQELDRLAHPYRHRRVQDVPRGYRGPIQSTEQEEQDRERHAQHAVELRKPRYSPSSRTHRC